MEAVHSQLASLLLDLGRSVAVELDAALQVNALHNALLLDEWREAASGRTRVPHDLDGLLQELFSPGQARQLAQRIAAGTGAAAGGLHLGVAPLRGPRGGAVDRHAAISLHATAESGGLLLVLRDVSTQQELQQGLGETRLALDAAMAALRAPPHALRLFLGSALTSISAIRSILKLPARDQDAVHDKLARLHAAVAQLGQEAGALRLSPVQDACQALLHRVSHLLELDHITGDALLPLAMLVDRIAAHAGVLWRIEEQRHVETTEQPRSRQRPAPDWTHASERRWASYLRHRGEELGLLVTYRMEGGAHVPRHLRVAVDDLLKHMLRNAVEHGIETPEERLLAHKPAGATLLVKFESMGPAQLRMSVQDDGRGRGPGLTFLRRAVARLGGQIAVAAKPGQYTQFVIDLPHALDDGLLQQVATK